MFFFVTLAFLMAMMPSILRRQCESMATIRLINVTMIGECSLFTQLKSMDSHMSMIDVVQS